MHRLLVKKRVKRLGNGRFQWQCFGKFINFISDYLFFPFQAEIQINMNRHPLNGGVEMLRMDLGGDNQKELIVSLMFE